MNTGRDRNNLAVFALTSGGAALAGDLATNLGAHLYLPARLENSSVSKRLPESTFFFDYFRKTVSSLFSSYRGFVFIMAAGIVVRTIAPLLRSKYTDPAVVVMDEAGQFAVSLVSGHVGGANELAGRVAVTVGAVPVITTATDVRGKPAVDMLAKQLNCIPVPSGMVKEINRALAEGEPVRLSSRWALPEDLTRGFEIARLSSARGWEVIIDRDVGPAQDNTLYLLPRNLVVGVGCRRGVPGDVVIEALDSVFAGLPGGSNRVKIIATIDIKKDEEGIYQAAHHYGLPVKIVSRAAIKELAENYEESEFVKKTLGVGGVCEPAAIIASNRGRVIIPKRKIGPVTVAVAEERLWWWDWDRGTGNA